MRPLKTTMLNTRCRGRQGWPGGWTPWVRFGSGCPSSELQTAAQQSCQIRCSRQLSSRWLTTGCTFLQPSPRTRTCLPRQCRTWWPTTCLCFKRWRSKWSSWTNSFQEISPKMTLKYPYLRATKCLATKLGFLAERRNQVLQVSALVIVSWWKILKFVSTRISPYLRGEGLRSDDK